MTPSAVSLSCTSVITRTMHSQHNLSSWSGSHSSSFTFWKRV